MTNVGAISSSSSTSTELIPPNNTDRLDLIHRIQDHLTKKFQVYSGKDTNGNEYDTIEEMWRDEHFFMKVPVGGKGGNDDDEDEEVTPKWYNKSHTYWETDDNVEATIDGMLGGFSVLSDRDLAASRKFLDELIMINNTTTGMDNNIKVPVSESTMAMSMSLRERIEAGDSTSCECGAGIGRVTKGLMLPFGINKCDLVETSPRLINAAPDYIGEDRKKCKFICEGLQDFRPQADTYDIIWVQWVIGYLTDWDLCNFFHRMGKALRQGGVIIVKDNTCNDLAFMADKGDSDVTRSFQYLMAIVRESGLKIVKAENGKDFIRWQDDFPDSIWPVPMIALTM